VSTVRADYPEWNVPAGFYRDIIKVSLQKPVTQSRPPTAGRAIGGR
jgi:hypothetical protein